MGCGNFTIITPIPVDGRPLLPSLPSHRTLFADTFFAAFPSYALSADTLRESKLLPPFTRVQPSAGGRPRYRRRAIGDTYSVPSRLGPSVDGRRRMSGSPVKKENQKTKFLGLAVGPCEFVFRWRTGSIGLYDDFFMGFLLVPIVGSYHLKCRVENV